MIIRLNNIAARKPIARYMTGSTMTERSSVRKNQAAILPWRPGRQQTNPLLTFIRPRRDGSSLRVAKRRLPTATRTGRAAGGHGARAPLPTLRAVPLERVPGRALGEFQIADIGAEAKAEPGADRHQHDVVGGERRHAEAA